MNKKFLAPAVAISAVLVAGLVLTCVLLWRQFEAARTSEQAARSAAMAEASSRTLQEERLREAEHERARTDKQNQQLAELTANLRAAEAKQASNVTALTRQLKAGGAPNAGGTDSVTESASGFDFAKMLKDPAMKDMIRSQQKMLMKTMYGPMFKDLNLTTDQQQKLSDLMTDSQMSGVEDAASLFGNDAAAKTNAINAVAEKQKKLTEDIKSLLGDEKYAQYEDYQKSMADRMILNQYQQQSAGSETALRDDQLKAMIGVMKEERARVPPVIGDDTKNTAENIAKLSNPDLMEQQFKWQDDFNKRVLDRAGKVLNPDQLKEFTEFQDQQSNMQKMGIKMAQQMFGGNKGGGAAEPVNPK